VLQDLRDRALTLLFGSRETSDAWVDALRMWWLQVRAAHGHVKRLVIYLDNGPKNSGRWTQFLKRMIQFADWSRLEIRLVYYPPYHSKYNPIERCMSYTSFSAHLARISCRKSLCHIRYRCQFARLLAKTGSSQPLWTQ
jgi:transposase